MKSFTIILMLVSFTLTAQKEPLILEEGKLLSGAMKVSSMAQMKCVASVNISLRLKSYLFSGMKSIKNLEEVKGTSYLFKSENEECFFQLEVYSFSEVKSAKEAESFLLKECLDEVKGKQVLLRKTQKGFVSKDNYLFLIHHSHLMGISEHYPLLDYFMEQLQYHEICICFE